MKIDIDNFINSKNVLNNIFIPKENNLLFHSIINFQVNDFGSLKAGFHFRTLFDVVNISNTQPDLIYKLPNSSHFKKIKIVMKNLNLIDYKSLLDKKLIHH